MNEINFEELISSQKTRNSKELERLNLKINTEYTDILKRISVIYRTSLSNIVEEFFSNKNFNKIQLLCIPDEINVIKKPLMLSIDKNIKNELKNMDCSISNIINCLFYNIIEYFKKNKSNLYNVIISNTSYSEYKKELLKNRRKEYEKTENYKQHRKNKKYNYKRKRKDPSEFKVNQEYKDFHYEVIERNILDNYVLTNEDIKIINNLQEKYTNRKYYPIVKELYILFMNGYSPKDLGRVFNKNNRVFQMFFKDNGLARNRFEAQAIAKEKRDYKQILNKGRETRLKNNADINGSKPEIYTRQYLNCRLPLELSNIEIIVGLNNKSILENGKEIDIPIIIINNDKMYKFAVEYNGDHWHEENKDKIKAKMINNKGYHLFYISPKPNATDNQIKECIENEVDTIIIPFIKNIIKGDKLNEQ